MSNNRKIWNWPYEVTPQGAVYNSRTQKRLKMNERTRKVTVWHDGRVQHIAVKRIVYETFCGKIPENHMVVPADNDPGNCAASNLKLVKRVGRV